MAPLIYSISLRRLRVVLVFLYGGHFIKVVARATSPDAL